MVYMDPQATATAAAAAAALLSPGSNGGIKIQSTASIPTAMPIGTPETAPPTRSSPEAPPEPSVTYSTPFPASNGVSMQQQHQPQPQPQRQPMATASSTPTNTSGISDVPTGGAGASAGKDVADYRARQLVDQFATLASRLGINLPDSVLKSLTSAATNNDPTLLMDPQRRPKRTAPGAAPAALPSAATKYGGNDGSLTLAATGSDPTLQVDPRQEPNRTAAPTAVAPVGTTATATATGAAALLRSATSPERTGASLPPVKKAKMPPTRGDGSGETAEAPTMAPTVMELRNMAEEAIAAVTQSNKHGTASKENLVKAATSAASTQHHPSGGDNNHKPTYSKRRKKPRLSDCEAKLAKLRAENEQLKRHLQKVSNKANKFDREKEDAGKQIARLLNESNAGAPEMERTVRKFSDMYSDYGVNRQQELSFHLEQLQRLVNPTNFTKMGLWTLGQSPQGWKKNPIAGILVKELDITPQQGRKILDQSEKIRKLCENLKETHALLVKLKLLCEKKTRCFQDRMNKCTEILTSQQVAKLIIWINQNTQLIEKICPGWGTEHIQSKK